MRRNIIETVMGAVVLLTAIVFVVFALRSGDTVNPDGYIVKATFVDAAGLADGTEVRLAGVKIGEITGQSLDMDRLLVTVIFTLDPSISLPEDTTARVVADGLLGGTAVRLDPGVSENRIPPGGEIRDARASVNIVDMIGQTIFSAGSGDDGGLGGDLSFE